VSRPECQDVLAIRGVGKTNDEGRAKVVFREIVILRANADYVIDRSSQIRRIEPSAYNLRAVTWKSRR